MFANLLAEIARHGMSKADVAKLLNISENTLRWKLNGQRPFLLDEIYTLATTFNVSLDYLAKKTELKD